MKTGDRVKCVKSHSSGLGSLKGKDYIVYNEKTCECGQITFDIGISIPNGIKFSQCYCGSIKKSKTFWHDSKLFRKVEEKVNYVKLEVEVEEPCLN